jgi:hypothetical protein
MTRKILIEVDPQHELLLRRTLAVAEEMEQLALTAPDGQVFQQCEEAILENGRRLQSQMLRDALQRRLQEVEKKGGPYAPVLVADKKRTKAPNNAS